MKKRESKEKEKKQKKKKKKEEEEEKEGEKEAEEKEEEDRDIVFTSFIFITLRGLCTGCLSLLLSLLLPLFMPPSVFHCFCSVFYVNTYSCVHHNLSVTTHSPQTHFLVLAIRHRAGRSVSPSVCPTVILM